MDTIRRWQQPHDRVPHPHPARAMREDDTLIVWKLDRHQTCDSGAHPRSLPLPLGEKQFRAQGVSGEKRWIRY